MFWLIVACVSSSKKEETTAPPVVSRSTVQDVQIAEEICDFEALGRACLGKRVRLIGSVPDMIYNHPIISESSGENAVQSYIDSEERQIIVLSSERKSCSKNIEVLGILREIDMGGEEGTRGKTGEEE